MRTISGAGLQRPELFKLLSDCHPGDILLIEQVHRLSRLNAKGWGMLKAELAASRVRVVTLDLPMSLMLANTGDEMTARMLEALNGMMLDMLTAIARKDYTDRRRRQQQGIEKARAAGSFKGRREDEEHNGAIMTMMRSGASWNTIIAATGCSRSTLSRLGQRIKSEAKEHGGG